MNSNEIIGDNLFLKPDKFIAVKRKVEMYAWVEEKETRSKTNIGVSKIRETTYTYRKDWTESPESSDHFIYPGSHENPQKLLNSYTNKVTAATIRVYSFDPQSVTLSSFTKLSLNSKNVELSQGQFWQTILIYSFAKVIAVPLRIRKSVIYELAIAFCIRILKAQFLEI